MKRKTISGKKKERNLQFLTFLSRYAFLRVQRGVKSVKGVVNLSIGVGEHDVLAKIR